MDIPISRASAFLRRNRSTHSWYGGDNWGGRNDVMSRSCPTPRTLADHMRQARSAAARPSATTAATGGGVVGPAYWARGSTAGSDTGSAPVVIRAKSHDRGHPLSSSASSPGPTPSLQVPGAGARHRHLSNTPSAAYSYDGGFFVTANNSNKDFFVIHPEWVSETETMRKLSSRKRDGNTHGVNHNQATPHMITWKSYKRSKSAPPPKFRNPITWAE